MLTPAERTNLVTRAMELEREAERIARLPIRFDDETREQVRSNFELAANLYARATSQTTI